MADEKKRTNKEIKNEELTDEQANEAAGGYMHVRPTAAECDLCGRINSEDQMLYTYINGERRHVCFRCAGVR